MPDNAKNPLNIFKASVKNVDYGSDFSPLQKELITALNETIVDHNKIETIFSDHTKDITYKGLYKHYQTYLENKDKKPPKKPGCSIS